MTATALARDSSGRWRTVGIAALTLWLPPLLPPILGAVAEGQAGDYFASMLPLPGLFWGLVNDSVPIAWGAMALTSIALLAGLTWWLRALPRGGARFVQTVLMAAIAAWSFFWALLLEGMGC